MEISPNARITYEKRYLIKDERGTPVETPEDLLRRVAANLALVEEAHGSSKEDIETIKESFFRIMADGLFMPNSPTLMNAGRELQQLSACFVLPLEDSMEGIFTSLKNMALVQKTGGGTGFAFDRLRPSNDLVKSTNGVASGPISFLKIFDAATEAVKQGGTRRGANMGSLIYNHPDILAFICCKEKEDEINNFNLSVCVSDEFMRKAIGDDPDPVYDLINPRTGQVYYDPETGKPYQLDAKEIFDLIVLKAWEKGDPGVIFIDQMNKFNPTPHIGKYETTNPCVPGDTLVHTTSGPKMVKDLIGKNVSLIINGIPYNTSKSGFFSTGFKPLFSIRTKEGYSVRTTGDHPILKVKMINNVLKQEWTKADDIKPGDLLMLHNHRDLCTWQGLYSEKEGYRIGLLVCDNSFVAEKSFIPLQSISSATASRKTAHNAPVTQLRESDYHRRWEPSTGSDIGENHVMLKEAAFSLGINMAKPVLTSHLETQTSSAFITGLLKAFFAVAGSIETRADKSVSIRLNQNDREKLNSLQRMLLRLGIASSLHIKPRPELVICGDNIAIFAEKIGFSNPAQKEQLELALKSVRFNLEQECFTVTVDAIEPCEAEEVYDVQVPGINRFDANGIVVHNCGEQPLLPYEACCLGSINLGKFITGEAEIDWDNLGIVVKTAVRFLDNVIEASNYVIPEIAAMHREGNRKIGLGIMGWHDMLVNLGIGYDSEKAIDTAEQVMSFINTRAKEASVVLAEERSVYPNFTGSIYDTGKPEDRVRNATRTTIAPTGTISILAGASSGIEPYFSIAFIRKNILGGIDMPEVNPLFLDIAKREGFYSEELIEEIARSGRVPENSVVPAKYKQLFKTAMEIDYTWHVRHQAAFQKHTDNAVSKTVNLRKDATVEDVKNAYISAWEAGCKGITVYRDSSRTKQVLNAGDGEKEETLKPTKRPKTLSGHTTSVGTALGNLFVTVNSADSKPFELFAQIGKAGSDVIAFTEAIARLISLSLRCGVSVDEIVTQLEGIGGARSVGFGPNRIMSVPDAIGQSLRKLTLVGDENLSAMQNQNLELCPDCGTCALVRAEGCLKCEACGFSEC